MVALSPTILMTFDKFSKLSRLFSCSVEWDDRFDKEIFLGRLDEKNISEY